MFNYRYILFLMLGNYFRKFRYSSSNHRYMGLVLIIGTHIVLIIGEFHILTLEPPPGAPLIGMSLDWAKTEPYQFGSTLGFRPAIFGAWIKLDTTAAVQFDFALLKWYGERAQQANAWLELTIEPTRDVPEIGQIPQSLLDQIAQQLRIINTQYGTPVLLRFGHEMNGDWTAYGMAPTNYILGFRRMADSIRQVTNLTGILRLT